MEGRAERWLVGWEWHVVKAEPIGLAQQVGCGCERKEVPGHAQNFGLKRGMDNSRGERSKGWCVAPGARSGSSFIHIQRPARCRSGVSHQQPDLQDWCPEDS